MGAPAPSPGSGLDPLPEQRLVIEPTVSQVCSKNSVKYDQKKMDSFFGKGISALNSTDNFSLSLQIEKLM